MRLIGLAVILTVSLTLAPLAAQGQLVINLKTAKELGQTIPQTLLQRADQVIQ